MKKRRIIAFLLMLCILSSCLLFSACEKEKEKTTDPYEGYPPKSDLITEHMQPGELAKWIEERKFNAPLEKLSGSMPFVNFWSLMPREGNGTYSISRLATDIFVYNDRRIGVEHLQLLDEDHLCAVSRLEEDGKSIYGGTVFERSITQWYDREKKEDMAYEDWITVLNSNFYFGKVLDSTAFSSVQPGDRADRLVEIDDALEILKKVHIVKYEWLEGYQWEVYVDEFNYLLTDGVMYVELDRTVDPDNPTVKTITFYAYGAEDGPENLVFLKGENRIQLS